MYSLLPAKPHIGLVMLDSKVYAVSGRGDSIKCYNPRTNSWHVTKCVGLSAYYQQDCVVELDGLIYFIGKEQICTFALKSNQGSVCWREGFHASAFDTPPCCLLYNDICRA